MTNQAKNNNLHYLIDPTFNKVNRLFVLSFENEKDRIFFSKHYTLSAETKNFNILIDGIKSFWCANKKQTRNIQKIIEMSWNNDYATGNLLHY